MLICPISDVFEYAMARCSSTRCKRREEELLANQMEQRRLLANHVVTHAAKVANKVQTPTSRRVFLKLVFLKGLWCLKRFPWKS